MTSIAGVQQVQIQVRVAEVSRSALRTMGINAFHTDDDFFVASRPGSASGGALVPSIDIGPPSGTVAGDKTTFVFNEDVTAGSLVTLFAGFPRADFEIFLQALAENQYLRVLANPTLVALSGEKAEFLVGGEYPIPVVQGGGGGGSTSVTIEYKEYGIRLLFEPTVLGDGTIRLKASQMVSDLSDVGSVTVEGFSIPALTTRKVETTLELNSGQTFAMAGLLKHTVGATTSGVPGLSKLPILGPLFRSVRYSEKETELVMLVTAELVEPMSLATTPPLPGFLHSPPNDWEFYIKGRIEGEEPAKINSANAQWLEKMGLAELFGAGAWDSYGKGAPPSQAQETGNTDDAQN
jgi:pilus assembly protein CpaC